MGPNFPPRRAPGTPTPREPLTHEKVDKLLRPQRGSDPQEEWVIKTPIPRPRDGRGYGFYWPTSAAYWGTRNDGSLGITPYVGNASRFESENAALYQGYAYKEAGRLHDFEVEQLTFKSRRR